MKEKQQQLLANIIRDAGIILGEKEYRIRRKKAMQNLKKNVELLELNSIDNQ